MGKCTLWIVVLCTAIMSGISVAVASAAELLAVPRVDVHAHVGDVERMEHYLEVDKVLRAEHGAGVDIWIDLNFLRSPDQTADAYLQTVRREYDDRFLPCINDFKIQDGLRYSEQSLEAWLKQGIVGYKMWFGVTDLMDDPMFEPTFAKMEELGMVGASIHIAQPYPTSWCDDPVRFWQAQNAWERVLDRHPRLKVVNAHMLDHFNSDEQLDYLTYVLETYPNVYVDLGARFQQFHRMQRDKLRAFVIKYADRILYGTDIGSQPRPGRYAEVAQQYLRTFLLLETDQQVQGGFFSGETEAQGLALPAEVLKKIYYENAARLYPRVKTVLRQRGYTLE